MTVDADPIFWVINAFCIIGILMTVIGVVWTLWEMRK